MKRLLIPLILLIPALASAQPVSPFPPGVTPPIFGLPASAVNGSGVLSTTCLSWPLGTTVCEDAAQRLTQRNTTSAERFDVANTWASTISNELFSVDWQTQANVALVGTRTAATGTSRPAQFESQADNGANAYSAMRLQAGTLPFIQSGLINAAGGNTTTATAGTFFQHGLITSSATSGTVVVFTVTPTYNQSSGTAANTDLDVNRTETAVGSGAQYSFTARRGGTNQFSVTAGTSGKGTQIGTAQAAVPTCSSNCGTSPSVVGSDSAMRVTMGSSGVPASGWVVTFNGTWPVAPVCTVTMAKTGMVIGKLPLTVVTTQTTLTVVTNGTAPATTDVYSIICLGVQ